MTPKERATAALRHEPFDRVPIYQAGFSSDVASKILGREAYVGGGIQRYRESLALWQGGSAHEEFLARCHQDACDLTRVLDLDVVRPGYWRMPEKPVAHPDDLTFVYGDPPSRYRVMRLDPRTEIYEVVEQRPDPEPTLEQVEQTVVAGEKVVPQPRDPEQVCAEYLSVYPEFGEERLIWGPGIGLAVPNRSQTWLEAVALRPDLVARYVELQLQRNRHTISAAAEVGAHLLRGGGDMATMRGPLYSPRFFHEVMSPRFKQLADWCAESGCFYAFASDGDLWPVADDLFGYAGVQAFHEIDRLAGMDLRKLRQRFPRLTLFGNIASQTLHQGTRENVVEETLDCLAAAKECGGIVVGCSNQIVAGTPMENVEAMMETLHGHR